MEVDGISSVNARVPRSWVIYLLMSGYCGGGYLTCECTGIVEVGNLPVNVWVLWRWVIYLLMSGYCGGGYLTC